MSTLLLLLLLGGTSEDLTVGQRHRGEINNPSDTLVFSYKPSAQGLFTLDLESYDFDVHLTVRADGEETYSDDNNGIETNAHLVLALRRDVNYEFVVSSRGGTGEFDFRAASGRLELETGLRQSAAYRLRAAERAYDRGDQGAAALHNCIRGEQLSSLADYAPAIDALEVSLSIWEELGNERSQVRALEALAYCHVGDGHLQLARARLKRMVKIAKKTEMRFRELNGHKLLAQISDRMNDPRNRTSSLKRQFELAVEREEASEIVEAGWAMFEHCVRAGVSSRRKYLEAIVPILEERGEQDELRRACALIAHSCYGQAEPKKEWALKGLAIGRAPGDVGAIPKLDERPMTASLLGSLAVSLKKMGSPESSAEIRKTLESAYDQIPKGTAVERALEIADSLLDMAQFNKAHTSVRQADVKRLIEAAKNAGRPDKRAKALAFLAMQLRYDASFMTGKEKVSCLETARNSAQEALRIARASRAWGIADDVERLLPGLTE